MTLWLFVYAADSGPLNAALDWAHKLVSPSTYACGLCRITYGAFGRRDQWTQALERLPGDKEFLHRDEFLAAYPDLDPGVPSVWVVDDGLWRRVLGPGDWEGLRDVAGLEARLRERTQSAALSSSRIE